MSALYLLHLDPPLKHARPYLGFSQAEDVTQRVSEHLACGAKASPLVKAALHAGSRVTVARTWTGSDVSRTQERKFKNAKNVPHLSPICRERKRH